MVKDAKGQPLPGATVLIKGTSIGVATDVDGKYTIMVNNLPNPVLLFSSVGMQTKEVKIGTSNNIDVILEEDMKEMDERKRQTAKILSEVRYFYFIDKYGLQWEFEQGHTDIGD